jgi:hypothetical protein
MAQLNSENKLTRREVEAKFQLRVKLRFGGGSAYDDFFTCRSRFSAAGFLSTITCGS